MDDAISDGAAIQTKKIFKDPTTKDAGASASGSNISQRRSLARRIAAIALIVWKKEVRFEANYLKPQAVSPESGAAVSRPGASSLPTTNPAALPGAVIARHPVAGSKTPSADVHPVR
jgi:hypothetical protein